MASQHLQEKIMAHLSEKSDTWGSTVSYVAKETGAGEHFVEDAMKHLAYSGKLKRLDNGQYMPGGNVDGKYDSFTDKRLKMESGISPKSGTFVPDPQKQPLTPDKAV